MKVLDWLRKFSFRLGEWLKLHRRPLLLGFWFLVIFAAGGVYAFLSQFIPLPLLNPAGLIKKEPLLVLSSSKLWDRPHPVSGVFYPASVANGWSSHRPLAVMIDNHELARPHHSGLQKADVIYEAVAEGGITRFLAVFHSQSVDKIGPVRSARVYYIDWALEFPAYYAHIGGATTAGSANIDAHILNNGVLSLNQFRLGTSTYTFGGSIVTGGVILSNIYYTSTTQLWEAGERLYPGTNTLPDFAKWQFKADASFNQRPETQEIAFEFWGPSPYSGIWTYDRKENVYRRSQNGSPHLDQATGGQLFAKNVILAYMKERSAGDGTAHRLYANLGSGDAVLHRDGKEILATWERPTLNSRMVFYERGPKKEIEFNRGLTWIEIVPK